MRRIPQRYPPRTPPRPSRWTWLRYLWCQGCWRAKAYGGICRRH